MEEIKKVLLNNKIDINDFLNFIDKVYKKDNNKLPNEKYYR